MLTFPLGPAWPLLQARVMRSREGALSCKERYTKKSRPETSELPSVASRNPGLQAAVRLTLVRRHGVLFVDRVFQ